MAERRHLGGQVSPEAYQGWHDFARIHGINVSVLLEVVGLWLGEQDAPIRRFPEPWRSMMARARDLAALRRRRS